MTKHIKYNITIKIAFFLTMKKIFSKLYLLLEDFLHQITTKIAKVCSNSKNKKVKNFLINFFIQRFEVKMSDAIIEDPFCYDSFNDFFTRSLKQKARNIDNDKNSIVSPVDGTISEAGIIKGEKLFQAKGMYYEISTLLDSEEDKHKFDNGSFATIYLAPTDYHRVHIPYEAKLVSMKYIPGRLYPVKPEKVATVKNIFAVNERLVCNFQSNFGSFSLVMVGAQLVSGIETVWHGPVKGKKVKFWDYTNKQLVFSKGQEIGRFNFGSTVILCFPKNIKLSDKITSKRKVELGIKLAVVDK